MTGLAPIDGLAVLAVVAKAAGYGAALLAIGGIPFVAAFRRPADPGVLRLARRLAASAALAGLAGLAACFGIRAARISGMGWEGATDPVMLGFVWQSPLGAAALWRAAGDAAVTAVLLTVAFWVGALAPLRRAAKCPDGSALLHRLGTVAAGAVGLLVFAGAGMGSLLSDSFGVLIGTAYGWGLLARVAAVAGLLGLAALNKWRPVPAPAAGAPRAPAALRRSIAVETAAVAAILLAAAATTNVTTPPVNL